MRSSFVTSASGKTTLSGWVTLSVRPPTSRVSGAAGKSMLVAGPDCYGRHILWGHAEPNRPSVAGCGQDPATRRAGVGRAQLAEKEVRGGGVKTTHPPKNR